jgi:hypothetical protein
MEVVEIYTIGDRVLVMVFNATFNNISVISTTVCDKVCQVLDTTVCDKVCQVLDTTVCDKVCQVLDTTVCDKVCQVLSIFS